MVTIAEGTGGSGSAPKLDSLGLFGYNVKKVTLQGGRRYLVIHKSPDDEAFVDLAMTGLVVGIIIPLKESGEAVADVRFEVS